MTQMMTGVPLQLVDLALRSVALAAVAAIVLAVFQVRATALRLMTWRGVLCAALAMPLLAWILPPLHVPVPLLLQSGTSGSPVQITKAQRFSVGTSSAVLTETDSSSRRATRRTTHKVTATTVDPSPSGQPARSAPGTSNNIPISLSALAIDIYFAVALILLARMIVGLIFSHRLIRKSTAVADFRITTKLAGRVGTFVADVVESSRVSVPVTIGIGRSKIVLPMNWREWESEKLDAVIAHELSHVTRRDPLIQFLSLLHRAIFWFSPLAWWLERHLSDLAEQASDEAALSCGADRNDYARTLLGFFEVLHTSPGRVWWQGVSMAKTGQAERRLERILAWKGMVTMSLKKSVIIALFALALPAVYLTAAVRPAQDAPAAAAPAPPSSPASASDIPAPPPAANPAPAPAASSAASVAPMIRTAVSPVAAIAPVAPIQPPVPVAALAPVAAAGPLAPVAAWPVQAHSYGAGRSYSGKGFSYAFGYDDEQRFVIVSGNSDSMTMSGTGEDARHVERLKKQISGDFIWFSRDEKPYVIRDQATVARARGFWAPQEELGKKQEELGKRQEELGQQQEALGKKQEEVRVKVPDMTAELDRLKAKLLKLGPTATIEQLGDLQSEIGELQSKIGEIQSTAGEEQGKFGEEQGALGEKQGELGEQEGKLGEEQGRLAEKASQQMKELIDEAIKNGTAQPEPQSGAGSGTL